MMKICCFTGHRPKDLPWIYDENSADFIAFKDKTTDIIEKAIENGYTYFISGMAEGFDTIVVDILLELKNKYKNIIIEGAIPCLGQEKKWSEENQNRYKTLLQKIDKKTILSPVYTSTCMMERNDYMLANSELVIACYKGGYGGTYSTIHKAKKQGKNLIIINPKSLELSK